MELGTISAIVALATTIGGAIGGLFMKAFLSPIDKKTEDNEKEIKELRVAVRELENHNNELTGREHETRITNLEETVQDAHRQIGILSTNTANLVDKMDTFIQIMLNKEK